MTLPSTTSIKKTLELVCQKIEQETGDIKTFVFSLPKSATKLAFDYHAGQYLNFTVNIAGKIEHCCYTLSSSPTSSDYMSITIKRIPQGKISNYFHDYFKVGQSIVAQQVGGSFYLTESVLPKILLISAGSGVTPMLSMLRFMVAKKWKNQVIFIHSAKRKTDLIAQNEVSNLARLHGNCQVVYTLTQGSNPQWHGFQGRLDEQMLSNIDQINDYQTFVCGPKGFRKTAQQLLGKLGLQPNNYHDESFGEHEYSTVINNDNATTNQSILPVTKTVTTNELVSDQNSKTKVAIYFNRWHKHYQGNKQDSLLEQGEAAGLILPYSCRAGSCGRCKAKLVSGQVKQDSTDGLSISEQQQGYILLCSCRALTDVKVGHE